MQAKVKVVRFVERGIKTLRLIIDKIPPSCQLFVDKLNLIRSHFQIDSNFDELQATKTTIQNIFKRLDCSDVEPSPVLLGGTPTDFSTLSIRKEVSPMGRISSHAEGSSSVTTTGNQTAVGDDIERPAIPARRGNLKRQFFTQLQVDTLVCAQVSNLHFVTAH